MTSIPRLTLAAADPQARQPLFLADFGADASKVPSLDGLRAISIGAVLVTHVYWPTGPGGYGVFLFFIISGFLITRLLFAEQKSRNAIDLKNFYVRRVFRLYPVLIVFCIIAAILAVLRHDYVNWLEPLAALGYFSNFLVVYRELHEIPFQNEAFKVFWSLSVEEHFYIAFPLIFAFVRSANKVAGVAIAVIVGCALARGIVAITRPELVPTHYLGMLTHYRIDAIAFGVLLASLCEIPAAHRLLRLFQSPLIVGAAIVIALASLVLVRTLVAAAALRWPLLGFPLVVVIAAIVFSARYPLVNTLLNLPVVAWIGRLSYSLYVWHMLAIDFADRSFQGSMRDIVAIIGAFLIASISYYCVELPMIGLRKKLKNKRQ